MRLRDYSDGRWFPCTYAYVLPVILFAFSGKKKQKINYHFYCGVGIKPHKPGAQTVSSLIPGHTLSTIKIARQFVGYLCSSTIPTQRVPLLTMGSYSGTDIPVQKSSTSYSGVGIIPHEVSEGVRILRIPNGSVLTSPKQTQPRPRCWWWGSSGAEGLWAGGPARRRLRLQCP